MEQNAKAAVAKKIGLIDGSSFGPGSSITTRFSCDTPVVQTPFLNPLFLGQQSAEQQQVTESGFTQSTAALLLPPQGNPQFQSPHSGFQSSKICAFFTTIS